MPRADIECLLEALPTDLAHKKDRAALFSDGALVYIYGAGNAGKDVARLLTAQGVPVSGFLDRKAKKGAAWEGFPILVPDDPGLTPTDRRRIHVVLGVF